MERKRIGGGDFNPLEKWDKPKTLKGNFVGSREVADDEGRVSKIYTIKTEKGLTDFWGTGQLNFLLSSPEVVEGAMIELVYNGKKPAKIKIGKKVMEKDVHNFELYILS